MKLHVIIVVIAVTVVFWVTMIYTAIKFVSRFWGS